MATGNEIVFQVTYTPAKPQNYLKGDKLKKYYDQRKFYTCSQSDDILYYASHGETKDVISYSEDSRKSYGIFGQNGMLSGMQIKALRHKLQNTSSCVWHGFVSFKEEFGSRHCSNIESAMRFMQRNFKSSFLSRTHLNPDNVIWIAALHENTENLHIHFLFFEKEPKLLSGKAGSSKYTSRGRISGWAIKTAKAYFYSYFLTKSCEVHTIRDKLLSEIKERYLNPGMDISNSGIFRQLKALSLKLPDKGSLKYGSENMAALRPEIEGLIKRVISSDSVLGAMYKSFCSAVFERDNEIIDHGKQNGTDVSGMLLFDKMRSDLFSRIGSKIIDAALYIRKTRQSPIDKQIPKFVAKSLRRGKRRSMLREYTYLLKRINETALDCFEEYLKNLARVEEEQMAAAKKFEREENES